MTAWTVHNGGRIDAPAAESAHDPSPERARRLIRARELAGLTLPEAAKVAGWPRSVLLGLESGRSVVSDGNLQRLAKVYGASLAWLLGEGEGKP